MELSREEQTKLVTALHQGPLETPLWGAFLQQLRRCCGADYTGLVFRRGDGSSQVTELAAGEAFPDALKQRYLDEYFRFDPVPHHELRPNRVYTLSEFFDPANPEHQRFRAEFMSPAGIQHSQIMRVSEPTGYEAWVVAARGGRNFSAADADVLAGLAPHLATSLRVFAAIERERLRAGISGEAIRRLNFGWISLDAAGRIVEQDAQAERLLRRAAGLRRTAGGRLILVEPTAQAALRRVLEDIAAGRPPMRPHAIHLCDEPWLDMLLSPLGARPVSSAASPVLAAYVHGEEPSGSERQHQLTSLFGLSRNEARLALGLSRGRSIAQCAEELGLTLETTRLYSKRLYAKTGARGQADLVRLILTSVVALA